MTGSASPASFFCARAGTAKRRARSPSKRPRNATPGAAAAVFVFRRIILAMPDPRFATLRRASLRCETTRGTNPPNTAGERRICGAAHRRENIDEPGACTPSARSDVPPFMVMDVMAAAARLEAAGGRVIHMEIGQPAAAAPSTAIAAAQPRSNAGAHRLHAALGIPLAARARIARHYREALSASRSIPTASWSPPARRRGFMLAFLAMFEPGDSGRDRESRLSALSPHPGRAWLRGGAHRDFARHPFCADPATALLAAHREQAARRACWSPAPPIRPAR